MAAMCTVEQADTSATLGQIENLLKQALTADEADQVGDALSLYAEAETKAKRLQQQRGNRDATTKRRLESYMANIASRKEALSTRLVSALPEIPSAPPSYDTSTVLPASPAPIDRGAAPDGESLMTLSRVGAQMYSVSAEGRLSVPSYPAQLSIRRLLDSGTPFLRLGNWSCPLIAGETPALLTGEDRNTVMLPDPASVRANDSVAILLPPEVSAPEKCAFLRLMSQLTRLMVTDAASGLVREVRENDLEPAASPIPARSQSVCEISSAMDDERAVAQRRTSDRVVDGIKATSAVIARGLSWGADKGSALIHTGSNALRSRIEASQGGPSPAQPTEVNPQLASGASAARTGSHVVVKTSVKAAAAVGVAAKSVATWAAPHVKEGANRLLPTSWTQTDERGRNKAQSAVKVASAALHGFGTVYEALEEAAKVVGRATAEGTTSVVRARYGQPAGQVTENVLYSVGNVGMTMQNVRYMGPKGIAKTVAINTAHSCAEQQKGQRRSSAHQ